MGSNAIRYQVAEFAGENDYQVLVGERRPVRLGHGVYLSGRLDAAAMDAALETLADFATELERLRVEHYRAVATSAVRESRNGTEFVHRISEETGVELEVISGSEEARLVHLAVSRRIPLGDRRWLLVDLGGGSVEVSLVDGNGILWSESHTMGSVRLLAVLTAAGADPSRFRRLLGEYIATLKVPSAADQREVAGYIATGGTIETLAKLGGHRDSEGISLLPVDRLRAVIEQLARLSYRQRVEGLGLRSDRADVVLPASLVYERLAEMVGASEIIVPHVGIKEGVLYDLVEGLSRRQDHEDRLAREVLAGALTLGHKYVFDEAHGVQVAELALSIFDQLRSVHGFGAADRKILQAAALLHDIGQFVSYKGHHKHSLYLIGHSELPSFSHNEMQLVANVGRYHRKSEPAPRHPAFMELSEEERTRVTGLAALLRLADALDREHVQRVRSVSVKLSDQEVTLWLDGVGDLLLEGWAMKRKAQMFSRVFERKVRLRMVGEER